MAARPAAVVVERACKHYGRPNKSDHKPVLVHLNMTVERGIIYGLLGPSGCGKTTLLSCIVGRRSLDSGNIWVLGGRPGEKGSGVPGPRVGYMPQDIALVGEFTVRDAIYYFGRIYGMKTDKLKERFHFLSTLLELPNEGRLIKSLSGGQQRRVSLAAALVHEPELLILDEPTVGLDPVLRERIWEFLSELARAGTTVIITTHYIDETKQAHKIGLLRDGQLLAEDSPEEILRKFDCDTLEDAFLKLALRQHQMPRRRPTLTASPDVIPESMSNDVCYQSRDSFNIVTSSTDSDDNNFSNISLRRKLDLKATITFQVLTIKERPKDCSGRSKGRGLVFSVLFPIIQIVAFFSAVGHDPRDLRLAVVNEEAAFSPLGLDICKNSSLKPIVRIEEDDTCEQYMLSCWFLEEMEKKGLYQASITNILPYNTSEEAKSAVSTGKLYGALRFHRNFSSALAERLHDGDVPDDVLEENHQIRNFIKSQLYKTYSAFTKRSMKACGRVEDLAQMPVRFEDPIYGSMEAQMMWFMAPGVMITIIFFLPAMVTSTLMIGDRLEGVWERSAVAGVKPREMLHVHIALQAAVILLQTAEMMALAYGGYALPSRGSLAACALLLFLQGVCGMCYGFLLSIYCSSYSMSFFVVTGSFYPMILLCGILWPLEGMSFGLRIIALTLPFTIPSNSLRDIMEKGASISEPSVYHGFLVTIAWTIVTLSLCSLRLKFKKT
ncbi:unnamed protein product [Diatraea saccharalis]|uniref:ABC transporter domain-containing protein n=1 Tax=Diatraea saccharalis TaxID=40085 RepID=A0A9N9RC69_9NEOP|nr:unnamed protein product [Diatraea saccharalis]